MEKAHTEAQLVIHITGSNPVLTTQWEPSNEAPFFINNLMKYIKLFENFGQLPDFGTLRDFVNPDHFADDDGEEAYLDSIEAAAETMQLFGLDDLAGSDAAELLSMGFGDRPDLVKLMPLDRAVCVYNSNGLDHETGPGLKRLVDRFPGLFSWDTHLNDLKISDEAEERQVGSSARSSDPYEAISVTEYRDGTGVSAVQWSSYGWSAVFMLDSALQNK